MRRHSIALGLCVLVGACGASGEALRVGDDEPAMPPPEVEEEPEEPIEERGVDLGVVQAAFECEGATGRRARACELVADYGEALAIQEWPTEEAAVWWGPRHCSRSLDRDEFDSARYVFLSPDAAVRFGASGRNVLSTSSTRGQSSEAVHELNRRLVAAARDGADTPDYAGVDELRARDRWERIRASPVWAGYSTSIVRTDARTLGFELQLARWTFMRRSGDRIVALRVQFEDDGSIRPDFACIAELFHVTDAEVAGPDPDRPVVECGSEGLTMGSAMWTGCEGHTLGYSCEENGCRCERDDVVVSRFDRPVELPSNAVAHVLFAREHCGWNLEP